MKSKTKRMPVKGQKVTSSQKVKTRTSGKMIKQGLSSSPKLARTTFRTSREMDFFSEKELVTQTGHNVSEWPFVIVKELLDNALDACEEHDIPPVILVQADAKGIEVSDNGPGLPESTLQNALDFTVRASNREAYVAPDRGAQGNALKTLLAMPLVIAPEGCLIIETGGKRHAIRCGADSISQRPVITDVVSIVPKSKKQHLTNKEKNQALSSGTRIRMEWSERQEDGETVWPFAELLPNMVSDYIGDLTFAEQFRTLVEGFALFNPHANITLNWFGKQKAWEATNHEWQKWKPCRPTSPHWYETGHLERLIAAYLTHDRDQNEDRLLRDLLSEFDGLTGSQKRTRVLEDTDSRRMKLSDFVKEEKLDRERITKLLESMQRHTRPVNAKRLGIIGEEHLRSRLLEMGIKGESFRYSKKLSKDDLPWVLESAFGYRGEDCGENRKIFAGANWSGAIGNPFRKFGSTGTGLEAVLSDLKAGRQEPIVFVLHLAHPRIEYTDRGKSALIVEGSI